MLSAKYHAYYWTISATAAVIYHGLVTKLACNEAVFRKLLVPLGVYTVYLIWTGPRLRPRSWHLAHFAATGCLLVSLGAIAESFFMPGACAKQIKGLIHTLLAFSAVGALEPVRQNRKDIEPCYLVDIISGPHIQMESPYLSWASFIRNCYARGVFLVIFGAIMTIINLGLGSICGPEASYMSIWNAHMENIDAHFSSAVMGLFIVGPLVDMSETIFYLAHRQTSPKWMPNPGPLVRPKDIWHPLSHNAAGSFFMWMIFLGVGYRKNDVAGREALSGSKVQSI